MPGFLSRTESRAVDTGGMATEIDHEEIIRQLTEKMSAKYTEVDPARIGSLVREEVDALAERPVQDYVTVLAERAVKKSLKRSEK